MHPAIGQSYVELRAMKHFLVICWLALSVGFQSQSRGAVAFRPPSGKTCMTPEIQHVLPVSETPPLLQPSPDLSTIVNKQAAEKRVIPLFVNSVAAAAELEAIPYMAFSLEDIKDVAHQAYHYMVGCLHSFFNRLEKRIDEANGYALLDFDSFVL